MKNWELGLIIGCSVLSVILLALAIRFLCRKKGSSGESKPLLGDAKTSSTAAALRFDSHIPVDPPGQPGAGEFLDPSAMKRITAWIDDVEKARRADGLVPLVPPAAESVQLLGDTPSTDFGGAVTPRTPNSLSPRISGVDPSGNDSTAGVFMGYSHRDSQKING